MIDNKKFSRAKKAPVVTNNTKYRPGDVVSLKVVRANENAAFLDAGTGNTSDDIMLHKLQQTSEVNIGDEVKVYLYLDPSKRLTASMKLPKMREGQLGYVRVLSVTRDGGFVDIGAERGVFLPYSQMRGHVNPGQLVWVRLYRDKSGRQAVTMRVEEDMVKASKPAEGLKIGDKVTGTIYNILPEGFFLFTNQRFIAFLHRSEVPGGRLDFGQEVTCRVTYLREDGRHGDVGVAPASPASRQRKRDDDQACDDSDDDILDIHDNPFTAARSTRGSKRWASSAGTPSMVAHTSLHMPRDALLGRIQKR